MDRRRILTIEDDPAIRRGIADALEYAGFNVLEAGDGIEGASTALRCEYDLLLLDLVLPGKSGIEILEEVRGPRPTVPIIILTARGEERDRVEGLRKGADDYVVKPFSVLELLARVEAVLRRSPQRPLDVETIDFPQGTIQLARREVYFHDGARSDLSEKETALLRYFACHRGRAISREELLGSVWQLDPAGLSTRTVDMHVVRLRDKLREHPSAPRTILTVRGKGYMLATISDHESKEEAER